MRRDLLRAVVLLIAIACTLHCGGSSDGASPSATTQAGATPTRVATQAPALSPWEMLPAEVAVVVHADFESLRGAELFRTIQERYGEQLEQPTGKYLEFIEATGFELERDLDSFTLGGPADAASAEGPVYLVVRGTFDRRKIEQHLQTIGGVELGDSGGFRTFTTRLEDEPSRPPTTFAWIDGSTLIASPQPFFAEFVGHVHDARPSTAKSAVGTLMAAGKGQVLAAFEMPRVESGPATTTDGSATAPASTGAMSSVPAPFRELRTVLFSMNVANDLDLALHAEADNAEQGQAVEQLIGGYLGMVGMMAGENEELGRLLETLRVERTGSVVTMTLRMNGTDVLDAIEKSEGPAPAFRIGG